MNINNMKDLLKKAKLMHKNHDEFKKLVFEYIDNEKTLNIKITGNYKITLDIDFIKLLERFENDNEMMNDYIQVAINNLIAKIKKEEEKIIPL